MQQVLGYSPTKTGVSWLATSVTAFLASGLTGALLVNKVGVRKLLVAGLTLLALSMLWLARVPASDYASDLLPAFLIAGLSIGLCAPSVQISALSGVAESSAGIASGLVETMREVGGAAGVAAVSTALVSRAGLAGFHAGFVLIAVVAGIGALTTAVAFEKRTASATAELPALDIAGEFVLDIGAPIFQKRPVRQPDSHVDDVRRWRRRLRPLPATAGPGRRRG